MSKIQQFEQNINKSGFQGQIIHDEDLKNHTTMQVGGSARLFLKPKDEQSLVLAVNLAGIRTVGDGAGGVQKTDYTAVSL